MLLPVYIRLPYFRQASECFTHPLSTKVESVYHTIKQRPVFDTRKSLSGNKKDVSSTNVKSNILLPEHLNYEPSQEYLFRRK